MKIYNHWTEFPMAEWRWKDFSPQELACRGTGRLAIDERSMNMLQELRTRLGKPMILNSAYRSPSHNAAVGGAKGSLHMKALAYDCRMDNHDPQEFIAEALEVGFKGIGQYADKGFTHIDTRPTPASFGSKPWPETITSQTPEFASEPIVRRKTVAAKQASGTAVLITAMDSVVKEAAPLLNERAVTMASTMVALIALYFITKRFMRDEDG